MGHGGDDFRKPADRPCGGHWSGDRISRPDRDTRHSEAAAGQIAHGPVVTGSDHGHAGNGDSGQVAETNEKL